MQVNSINALRHSLECVDMPLFEDAAAKLKSGEWRECPFDFHWQDGDRFPALEEFNWRGSTEHIFSTEQCEYWARCMDWSKLRNLDLGERTTRYKVGYLKTETT